MKVRLGQIGEVGCGKTAEMPHARRVVFFPGGERQLPLSKSDRKRMLARVLAVTRNAGEDHRAWGVLPVTGK
ncbi:hypothetical protein HPP92_009200 [Vanilla planifolia]|uniref:Uncharacterized protein n=1 Tax=Vanilla planifolia TaxID=51239 RepID=A0A835R3U0_VANPL|nr:hypothetical protein HPP92_009200 [Vanilla planifolia]